MKVFPSFGSRSDKPRIEDSMSRIVDQTFSTFFERILVKLTCLSKITKLSTTLFDASFDVSLDRSKLLQTIQTLSELFLYTLAIVDHCNDFILQRSSQTRDFLESILPNFLFVKRRFLFFIGKL